MCNSMLSEYHESCCGYYANHLFDDRSILELGFWKLLLHGMVGQWHPFGERAFGVFCGVGVGYGYGGSDVDGFCQFLG